MHTIHTPCTKTISIHLYDNKTRRVNDVVPVKNPFLIIIKSTQQNENAPHSCRAVHIRFSWNYCNTLYYHHHHPFVITITTTITIIIIIIMLTTTKLLTLVGRRSVPRHLARTCRVSNTVSTWWVRAWSAVPKTNEALSVEEMMVAIEVR